MSTLAGVPTVGLQYTRKQVLEVRTMLQGGHGDLTVCAVTKPGASFRIPVDVATKALDARVIEIDAVLAERSDV